MSFNNTLAKFCYPESLITENDHWYTLLRPEQITFGSLILISKNEKNSSFSNLRTYEQTEMFHAIQKIEKAAFNKMGCNKINYLALMMVDPFVHFHVLPRFKKTMVFNNIEFLDPGYPGLADFSHKTSLKESEFLDMVQYLKGFFVE